MSTVLLTLLLILIPGIATAWGPATHLELSWRLLDNARLLPPQLATLILAHPLDFFYGSIAADIVVAKKFAHYLHHCHRWAVGLEVLDMADEPPRKSFALGYLTHLAADVVAHNYYVPYKMILGFKQRGRNHQFWEIRFDTYAPTHVWLLPSKISHETSQENDELLKKVLQRQLFSFKANKVFFNNVLLMGRFKKWHEIIGKSMARAKPPLDPQRVERYKQLSIDAAVEFLTKREDAWCFRADPTGHQSLRAAADIVRELRKARRKGNLTPAGFNRILEHSRPHLEASIYGEKNAGELYEGVMEVMKEG